MHKKVMNKSSINFEEVLKFGNLAKSWWNEDQDASCMLHRMNPLRIQYILSQAQIEGKKVLEVGCGGGILSIPLARIGAKLTALEPSLPLFEIAIKKAKEEGFDINFLNTALENCKESSFDVILIMDVLEHVENQDFFLHEAEKRLKAGGIMIISTINKTFLSKIFVKLIAEGISIIPKGTHDEGKFISPQNIEKALSGLKRKDISGFFYNPVCKSFKITKNFSMNYFLTLEKYE